MIDMTKRTNAAIADGLMRDAKRFDTLRRLAVMSESEQNKVFARLGEPEIKAGQDFDNWVDNLDGLFYMATLKGKRKSVPDEA